MSHDLVPVITIECEWASRPMEHALVWAGTDTALAWAAFAEHVRRCNLRAVHVQLWIKGLIVHNSLTLVGNAMPLSARRGSYSYASPMPGMPGADCGRWVGPRDKRIWLAPKLSREATQ